jgi:putative endonuclease
MSKNNLVGTKGEAAAICHLKMNGYEILDVNWRFLHLELDIIARKDNQLIIVEVKARKFEFYEYPEETVSRRKQSRIIKAAEAYINHKDIDTETRFDIIFVVFKDVDCESYEIKHMEDAFSPIANSSR